MFRRIGCLLAVAVAMLAAAPQALALPQHRADGNLSEWVGDPTWLSGETRISRGELIHDDWLYDDYGADLDQASNPPVFRSNLAPTRGDYRYPTNTGRYGYNAADLRQFRVAATTRGLHFLVYLQTMKQRDAAAVTVAIDDRRTRAKTSVWPDGAGLNTPLADYYITFWGTGGLITESTGHRERLRAQAVNLAENAIEVDVPWTAIRNMRGKARMSIVTGLANPTAGGYTSVPAGTPTGTAPGGGAPGSTAVFDLGFDSTEVATRAIGSHWGEERQSAALSTLDVSEYGYDVDIDKLRKHASDNYAPQAGRFYNRIFRSTQDFGEGIETKQGSPGGSPEPMFLSRYQPYGLYIPTGYTPGIPAQLLLNGHSLDVNQNEYAVVSPNLYSQLGDQRRSIVVTPLARGTDTWYITSGFKDVLEAWDDVKAHYNVDDDRTHIGGYSMGGYMTHRMGLLMPDQFASAIPYVGPPAYQLWPYPSPPQPSSDYQVAGQTNNIVFNGLNLPYEINNGAADELVPVAGAQQHAATFQQFGNPHLFYLYPSADHLALIVADEWGHTRDWMNQNFRRNETPTEVRYKRYPSMDLPQYGLRFDGAYWVDDMVVRTPSNTCTPGDSSCEQSFGQVEAYTQGWGRSRSVATNVSFAYPGPPFPADVEGSTRSDTSVVRRDFFDAGLVNLSEISFDMARMGINTDAVIEGHLTVSGAGPVTVKLKGSFGPVSATLDGQPVVVTPTVDGIQMTLTLTSQHDLVVTPQ
jgi:predicted esterase